MSLARGVFGVVLERIILSPTLVNVVFRLYTRIRNAHNVFLSFCSSQTMLSRIRRWRSRAAGKRTSRCAPNEAAIGRLLRGNAGLLDPYSYAPQARPI